MKPRWIGNLALLLLTALIAACARPSDITGGVPSISRPPTSNRGPGRTEVLLFAGASSWAAEVDSLADSLLSHGVTYQEVTSAELDLMSLDELSSFKLLVVPGGDAPTLTASLSAGTHARLRAAVQQMGLDYLGFCAGAWAAIAPAPLPGKDVTYGIGIIDGPIQEQTYLFKQGREFAIAKASFPDGTKRDLLWYGGPITPNTLGGVIAKYPDGNPAITQIWSGQGFTILSGLHPTANQLIMNALGLSNPEAIDPDFTWRLLDAGIQQKPLIAF